MTTSDSADSGGMATKGQKPTVTTTDLTDLVERDLLAETAAGVKVEQLRARLVDDGQGPEDHYGSKNYNLELQVDILLNAIDDEDISDRRLGLTLFDKEDLLFDVALDVDREDDGIFETRVASRRGRSLHSKYRRSYTSDEMPELGRMEFHIQRPAPVTGEFDDAPMSWEPDVSELEVEFTIDPTLKVEAALSRAIVRSGYNDGYVVSIHGYLDGSSQMRV
ncbi:MAG: hypothetical protein B7X41_00800 [Microbacterium sp. 14-71-5]|nr:MAG: hypothetical protein B7X41_00800 [Microbacterium sp. 14-71-5]